MSPASYNVPPTSMCAPVTAAARATMQANKGRDTGPEIAIRSILHKAGLRYLVDAPLPFDRRRRADISFTRVGLCVFIDGCFWHGCPDHFILPKTRTEFWREKIHRNRARDSSTDDQLHKHGLTSLRIWEHTAPAEGAALIIDRYWELRS